MVGVLQRAPARRPDHGHEPGPRRPPDPRHGPQLLAAACTRSTPYGVRKDTERIDYEAMAAQAKEVRPKLIVGGASAYPRIWDFERMAEIAHGVGALLFIDMAHIAGLVAAGVHPSPFPHVGHRHDHHPQDAPRPARRHDLQPRRPAVVGRRGGLPGGQGQRSQRRVDRNVFPGHPGRAADARHRRQGRRVQAGRRGDVPRGPAADRRERPGHGRDARRPGCPGRLGRHRQPPAAGRRDAARRDRQGGRAPARRDRDHGQQERDPVRRAAAEHRVGHPDRHAGDHVARLRPGRDARRSAGSSSTRSASATTRRSRRDSRARSARSSNGSRCRACPRREVEPALRRRTISVLRTPR